MCSFIGLKMKNTQSYEFYQTPFVLNMAQIKRKLDHYPLKKWTKEYGFVEQKDHTFYAFCYESAVCRTSSAQKHFQTTH